MPKLFHMLQIHNCHRLNVQIEFFKRFLQAKFIASQRVVWIGCHLYITFTKEKSVIKALHYESLNNGS